ncbi:MAG: FliI/YscN family ATPase [Nitrospinota bacterium]
MKTKIDFNRFKVALSTATPVQLIGEVSKVVGLLIESNGPNVPVGSICEIVDRSSKRVEAEVVGFKDNRLALMPLGTTKGVEAGCKIIYKQKEASAKVGNNLLGRVIDSNGNPLDSKGSIVTEATNLLYNQNLNPIERKPIQTPFDVGIKGINGLFSLGQGQRIGIIAGAGVGKSMLLGMITKNSDCDVVVIAMIGERGREVNDFIRNVLDEESLSRSVIIVATSDQSALERTRSAFYAVAVAEYFMEQNKNVLLVMDSLTRFANAQREIGLSIGEPPVSKGYPPSLFSILPQLIERAGSWVNKGSITAVYSILVEADNSNDLISDVAKSILDGHITLSRKLAAANHYPAIEISDSISRVMPEIVTKEHLEYAGQFKKIYATYKEAEDLINIGAYAKGSNKAIDESINKIDNFYKYLTQNFEESISLEESLRLLKMIFKK